MNTKQRRVIIVIAVILGLLVLFPPWYASNGTVTVSLGHHFINSNPHHLGSVDTGLLLTEGFFVALIGGIVWGLLK